MYYTYVLRSRKDKKCYIGSTSDLRRRFAEHQRGEVRSTAPRRPLELIFNEAFLHLEEALGRERYFKTTKGKVALKKMLSKTLANTL
jgi:putative endonuclease